MEMQSRSMTPIEQYYCYSQSQQISMQTGLIGYLRADMGSTGQGFYSTWNDFRADLKTEEFKAEFDEVINGLRGNDGFLHDRRSLTRFCYTVEPGRAFQNDRNEYGVRVNTEKYAYFMRLNPNQGEYNLYCYCYRRDWLDRHMKQAEQGIRFITPDYKELFRIPDGDKIRVLRSDGTHSDHFCRYIDECHVEIGDSLYHICQFAEQMERSGSTVIPLRSSLPEKCFSIISTADSVSILTKGESGYRPAGAIAEGKTARESADIANHTMGVTKAQEAAMLAGSMFGWATPAADPKNYDDQGQPIKQKRHDRGDAR